MYQVPHEQDNGALLGSESAAGIFYKVLWGVVGGVLLTVMVGMVAMPVLAAVLLFLNLSPMVGALPVLMIPGACLGAMNAVVQRRILHYSIPPERTRFWFAGTIIFSILNIVLVVLISSSGRFDAHPAGDVAVFIVITGLCAIGSVLLQSRIARIGRSALRPWGVASVLGWVVGISLVVVVLELFTAYVDSQLH